jgi:mono/diheme cytochrome c family protein
MSRCSSPAPLLAVLALTTAIGLSAAPAHAAGDPDKVKGVLVDHCAECHKIPGYSAQGLPSVKAPGFQEIADAPKTYAEPRLRRFLRQPHWPMAQFRLSPSDIDNFVAYLATLRGN